MLITSRWQAFGFHLAISLVIFLALLGLIIFVWFPGVFIHFGGYQGIKIVAGVDLVLGPLLTLIVYNREKRFLKLDLTIIAAIQAIALAAGIWVIYGERPLIQVLSHNGVFVHSLSELTASGVDPKQMKKFASKYPKIIFLDLPDSSQTIEQIESMAKLMDEQPITTRAELYLDIEAVEPKAISARLERNKSDKEKQCYWVKVDSPHRTGNGCFNIKKGLLYLENET